SRRRGRRVRARGSPGRGSRRAPPKPLLWSPLRAGGRRAPDRGHLLPQLRELRLVDAARDGLDVWERSTEAFLDARTKRRPQVVVEDAERVRPELLDSLLQAPASFVRGEQAVDPHVRV